MTGDWERVYLGLGSNLGDRRANLEAAVQRLEPLPDLQVLRVSGLYETEPVGYTDQPWFLNAVLEADTSLSPEALLQQVKRIEADLGRQSGPRWGPRAIDVDILLYAERTVDTPALHIPHKELENRLFVLVPLAEFRPDLELPSGRAIGERISELQASQQIRLFGPPGLLRML